MLNVTEVQKHLRDCLFHGLHKQLCDSMHCLYKDMRITYPQLMMAAQKAESEQEDQLREGVCARLSQSEGKENITRLSKKIGQLIVVIQKPQRTTTSNPQQSQNERDGNGNQHNTRGQVKNGEGCDCKGIKCF